MAVVSTLRRMLVEQELDGIRVEPPPRPCALVEQELACERAKVAAEPRRQRHAKPALPPACYLRRELVGERAPQRELPLTSALLEMAGQREPELDHAPVEQRRPQLERVGHGGDVGLRQQVAGQIRVDIEQLQAGDSGLGRTSEQEPGREERADLLLR